MIPITNFQQYVTNHGLTKCDITEISADQYNEYDDLNHVIIVVKSTNHFMAAYGPVAKKVIYGESGGPLRRDHRAVPYVKAERPIWPLDADAKPRGLVF